MPEGNLYKLEFLFGEGRHFIRILETTPDMVYIYDLAAEAYVYANRSVREFLGNTPDQVQGVPMGLRPTGDEDVDGGTARLRRKQIPLHVRRSPL